ncbi:MAG: hypothetical protein JWM27_3564 [Gemmatimonadetes bacterium]|nr:hypothetical protein [Gemmatimonadota bacterium]
MTTAAPASPAFTARIPAAAPIYEIVTRWWAARDGYGSILSTRPLWTRKTVSALHRAMTGLRAATADDASGERLRALLDTAPPEARQLAAEMMWVILLFPTDVAPQAKQDLVREIWSWSDEALPASHPHLAPLKLGGIGEPGAGFHRNRWREMALLARMVDAWKAMDDGSHKAALKTNPYEFSTWLDHMEDAGGRQLRHMMLHLLYPDTFEPIAGTAHKRMIARAYAHVARVERPDPGWSTATQLDARLLAIRRALQARDPGTHFDFRHPELARVWLREAAGLDGGGRLDAIPLEEAAERALAAAAALGCHRTDAGAGADGLLLLGAVLGEAVWNGSDGAAAALRERLWPGASPDRVPPELWGHLAERYRLPAGLDPDTDDGALYAPGHDVALDLIVTHARELAAETLPELGREVGTRHLLGVLLRPGSAYSVAGFLREQGADMVEVRGAMLDFLHARSGEDDAEAWRRILLGEVAADVPSQPGYVADDPAGEDRLAITGDVNALASVLAASSVQPPVSVGLFGDWGSGKSFFMRRMERRIADLSARSRRARLAGQPSAYCSGVVQIWFNAWHYLDANLWASLATRVFEGLSEALAPGPDEAEDTRKRLFGQLEANRALLAEAEQRHASALDERRGLERRAAEIAGRRLTLRERLDEGARTAGALLKAVGGDEAVKPALEGAARALRLPDDRVCAEQVRTRLAELRGMGGTLRETWALLRRQGSRAAQVGVASAGGALVGGGAYLAWRLGLADRMPAALGTLGTALAAVAALLSPWMAAVARARRMLESADAQLGRLSEARKERLERETADVHRELDRLAQAESAVAAEVDGAARRVRQAEAEIAEIRAGRRLERFIQERSASDDYRRHLGIVATIRADFERLGELLRRVRAEGGVAEVDRIVLYIDDLDRCPEERVVEVLQAVHLLLAFPLFVVIVGVDSRWLLRAVQGRYAHQLAAAEESRGGDENTEHWLATPQSYLEKIFQIPFALRTMENDGFGRLIGSLLPVRGEAPGTRVATTHVALAAPPPLDGRAGAPAETLPSVEGDPSVSTNGHRPADEPAAARTARFDTSAIPEPAPAPAPPPPASTAASVPSTPTPTRAPRPASSAADPEMTPRSLEVDPWELDYLQRLAPLIASPRAAKRFVNVYRFLRAALQGEELDRFRGTAGQPGEHQAAALLLAMLTGFHAESTLLFRRLLREGDAAHGGWWDFADGALRELAALESAGEGARDQPTARRWSRLAAALEAVRPSTTAGDDLQPFLDWAPRVARFSFQTTPLYSRRLI